MFWKRGTAPLMNGSVPADAVPTNPALWGQLRFCATQEPLQALAAQAAVYNGQPSTEGRALLREYLRFVYLACIARDPLAPSKTVDALWKAHIATGSHYFEDFGPGAASIALHAALVHPRPSHGPAYQLTLDIYRTEFGEEAPKTYWPTQPADSPRTQRTGRWQDWFRALSRTSLQRAGALASNPGGNRTTYSVRATVADSPPAPTLRDRLQAEAARGRLPFLAQTRLSLGEAEAVRLTTEYLRYLYLRLSSPSPIAPPDMIGQLWSEHARQAPDYLDRFCPEVLHATVLPDEANEEPDPAAAARRLHEEYHRVFGTWPPPDIWPGPKELAAIQNAEVRSTAAFGVIGLTVAAVVFAPRPLTVVLALAVSCLALLYMFVALTSSRGALLFRGKDRQMRFRSWDEWGV